MKNQNIDKQALKAIGSKPSKTINPHTKDGRARRVVRFHLDISRDDDYALQKQFNIWKGNHEFLPMLRKAFMLLISFMVGDTTLLAEYFPGIVESIRNEARTELETELAILRERIASYEEEIEDSNAIIEAQDKELAILRKQKETPQPAQDTSTIEAKIDRLEQLMLSQGYKPERAPEAPQKPEIAQNPSPMQPVGLRANGSNKGGGVGLKGLSGGGLSQVTLPPPQPIDDDLDDIPALQIKRDTGAEVTASMNFIEAMKALNQQ